MERYCLMYDGVFYNLKDVPFCGEPVVAEAEFGDLLVTYFDEDEAEAAKMAAYNRRIEFEENGFDVPELLSLIPELTVVSTLDVEDQIDGISLEMVDACELY